MKRSILVVSMLATAHALGCYGQPPSPEDVVDTPRQTRQAGSTCPIQRVVFTRWQDQATNIEAGGAPFRFRRIDYQPISLVTAPLVHDARWRTATAAYDWNDAGTRESVITCNESYVDIIRYRGRHVRFDVAEIDANTLYWDMARSSTILTPFVRSESYWDLFSGQPSNNLNTFMTYGVFGLQPDWQSQLAFARPTIYFRLGSTSMPDSGLQVGRIIEDINNAMHFQAWGRVIDQYRDLGFYENWNCSYLDLGFGPNSLARQASWRDREFLADYEVSCISGSVAAIMPRNDPWSAQQMARGTGTLRNQWSTISGAQQGVIGLDSNGCAVCRLQ